MDALRIEVDPKRPLSPSEQIAQQVRFAVAGGVLRPGDRLPSVRALAVEALVNPNTVGKAWRDLEREGVLEARAGDGVFVAAGAAEICTAARDAELRRQLERWVSDALSAGLGREELERWLDRTLGRGKGWARVGGDEAMNEFAVQARGLTVRFGRKRVLEQLDLEVPTGSVTALVGPNGAGKSTLLRVLVGALVPDGGRASVLGLDPARHGARVRAQVGYVPDRFEVSRWMRGRDWLAFVAPFYPTWSDAEASRVAELLNLDRAERVQELSKGNRAKLALVAALAHQPKVLLLDEAFSGLDVTTRDAVASAVLGHLREEGRTVLFASHSIADVERLADRIAVLEGGRIVRSGELEVVARAANGGVDLEGVLRSSSVRALPLEVS